MPKAMSADEIVEDLAERIKRGQYPPDSRLPTYGELSRLYDVSPATIGTIVGRLKERGLVYGIQGKGVYVSASGSPRSLRNPFSV